MIAENQVFMIQWVQQHMLYEENENVIAACGACGASIENDETQSPSNVLGAGAFGVVYDIPFDVRGKRAVVKMFMSPVNAKMVLREVSMTKIPVHENIIQTFSCVTLTVEGAARTGLLLEAASEELFDYLDREGAIPNTKIKHFMGDILRGVDWLHDHGVYHCDLKPENILLAPGEILKIADFGLAHSDEWTTDDPRFGFTVFGSLEEQGGMVQFFGTPAYLPTPNLACAPHFVYLRDEWAIGCIFFILGHGVMLYHQCSNATLDSLFDVGPTKTFQSFAQTLHLQPRPIVEHMLLLLLRPQPTPVKHVLQALNSL